MLEKVGAEKRDSEAEKLQLVTREQQSLLKCHILALSCNEARFTEGADSRSQIAVGAKAAEEALSSSGRRDDNVTVNYAPVWRYMSVSLLFCCSVGCQTAARTASTRSSSERLIEELQGGGDPTSSCL